MKPLQSYGLSDIGIGRSNNEDIWISIPEIGYFAIADGMGGHNAGEVAAKEAIEHLSESIKKVESQDPVEWIIELRHTIEKANHHVHHLGKNSGDLNGMGTTLCCLIWSKNAVIYAHVGDSRIYRLRNKKLQLLTEDHSLYTKWLKYGKSSEVGSTPYPYKNVITRAVGTTQRANPEISVSIPLPGDLFFLCTDGLSDVLTLNEMEKILNKSKDLQMASKNLIEKAKNKGSSDNITILIIQSENESGENLSRQQCDNKARRESLAGHAKGIDGPPCQSS